jgi:phage gp29-like protein
VARRKGTSYPQMPISSYAGWDRVWQIEQILASHDLGNFRDSAMLCDAMMRDDRIAGVMDTRIGSLLASPISGRPASARAKASKIARLVEGDDDNAGLWDELFPASLVRGLTKWGNFLNVAVAEIIWETTATWPNGAPRWMPRLRLWHPQFVWWDQAKFRFVLNTQMGQVELPRVDETPQSDGHWVIWCPRGYQYGWFDALVRRLAHRYVMRGWDYRDWSRYNEKHGMPILGGITPPNAGDEAKERFVDQLANLASESAVELPQGIDGEKYDLKMIEPTARTFDSFDKFKAAIDSDIAIAVLGQNLTTQVDGGGLTGTAGASKVHDRVALDRRKEDAKLAECLRQQVLTWWARHNFGDEELAPVVTYDVEPPADQNQEALALKGLGEGLKVLNEALDSRLDVEAISDEWGLPLISEEEAAARREKKMAEAQQAMGEEPGDGGASNEGEKQEVAPQQTAKSKDKAALSLTRSVVPGPAKRYEFQGFAIAVENPAGSIRVWKDDASNVIGSTQMLYDYGFFEGVMAHDGEELDVYVGPDAGAADVHVVHQQRKPDYKVYDEDKVFIGFPDAAAAKAAFCAHRDDGDAAFGGMSVVPLEAFRRKVASRGGSGKIRASAAPDPRTTWALEALVARAGGTPLSRNPSGARRAKLYSDAVAARSVKLAAAALASDLAGIKSDIDDATSFDDLKARIVRRYRDMDPAALAEVVRKANLLAHLGGRVTAIKQL